MESTEKEFLAELVIGEEYTKEVLINFLYKNRNCIFVSKTENDIQILSKGKIKLLNIIEGYEHKFEKESILNPNQKTFYFIFQ